MLLILSNPAKDKNFITDVSPNANMEEIATIIKQLTKCENGVLRTTDIKNSETPELDREYEVFLYQDYIIQDDWYDYKYSFVVTNKVVSVSSVEYK